MNLSHARKVLDHLENTSDESLIYDLQYGPPDARRELHAAKRIEQLKDIIVKKDLQIEQLRLSLHLIAEMQIVESMRNYANMSLEIFK